jgi:hypothetical protein
MSWTRRWVSWGAAGWSAPEDPDGRDDAELDSRALIADRLVAEAGWIRQCSGWLTRLHAGESRPAVNLRPFGDQPERALVVIDVPRVAAIPDRIAADIDELAGARRVGDLPRPRCCPAAGGTPPAAGRAGPGVPGFCTRRRLPASPAPQPERTWDAWQAERLQRGEISQRPVHTNNPFRPR